MCIRDRDLPGGGGGSHVNADLAYAESEEDGPFFHESDNQGHGSLEITLIEELPEPPPPPQPNTLENIYTDGRWYMPLNGINGEEQTQAATWEECRDRCLDTPGCKFFNRFSSGGCHITHGRDGHEFRPGNPTSHSGTAAFMEREVTLPMPEEINEDNYSAVTGGTVDCSAPDMKFLGVADSIRHNGHSSNWGTSMIDIVSSKKIQDYRDEELEIPCGNFYYYKPHTLSDLETEEGGGWFQSVGDNGVSPSGFYTLQHIGSAGSDNCTNYDVRTNQSNISDYACSEQDPIRKEDPTSPNPSNAILQGLSITPETTPSCVGGIISPTCNVDFQYIGEEDCPTRYVADTVNSTTGYLQCKFNNDRSACNKWNNSNKSDKIECEPTRDENNKLFCSSDNSWRTGPPEQDCKCPPGTEAKTHSGKWRCLP